MLFRVVRPVKRSGTRNRYFVRRIPADVRQRARGLLLSVPLGDRIQTIPIRVSLRTDDPIEVKLRQGRVDAYLENVWRALRETQPVSLSHRNATALAGELYRAWAEGGEREKTIALVHTPGVGWERDESGELDPDEWDAVRKRLDNFDDDPLHNKRLDERDELTRWEESFGRIVDQLLLAKGISRVDELTRAMLLSGIRTLGRPGRGRSGDARLLSLQRPDKTNPFKGLLALPDLCCSRVTEPSEWVGYEDWR